MAVCVCHSPAVYTTGLAQERPKTSVRQQSAADLVCIGCAFLDAKLFWSL